jgi:hypothetical protein
MSSVSDPRLRCVTCQLAAARTGSGRRGRCGPEGITREGPVVAWDPSAGNPLEGAEVSYPCACMLGMSQDSHPMVDISTVTPAQRAQIIREESALLEAEMDKGGIDNNRDVLVVISMRIEELEGTLTSD